MKYLALTLLLLVCSTQSYAELAGKKVIYVHGFISQAFLNPFQTEADRERDGRNQAGVVLRTVIDDYMYFNSAKRLSENAAYLKQQIKDFEASGICSKGCIFVTHSTGNLVTRYMISRLKSWGIRIDRFRVLASIDFAGASGGTEAAQFAYDVINGNYLPQNVQDAVSEALLGVRNALNKFIGIGNDLRPTVARSHAVGDFDVPSLRIAGGQARFLISVILKGKDDGLMPMHSACGSTRIEAIQSCSRSIKVNGQLTSVDGPKSLKYKHYPILMGEDLPHSYKNHTGKLVAMNNNCLLYTSPSPRDRTRSRMPSSA